MMNKHTQFNRGFTLVETLVAVAILMIAIAGPLTIANQALIVALGSRNAMIATYLAQEGMESIKNIKDNNGTANFGSGIVGDMCTSMRWCATPNARQNIIAGSVSVVVCGSIMPAGTCDLYTKDGVDSYIYSDNSSDQHQTPFTRYYYITNSTANEFIVTVVVSWTDGSIPNEIKLQELMTNASRG